MGHWLRPFNEAELGRILNAALPGATPDPGMIAVASEQLNALDAEIGANHNNQEGGMSEQQGGRPGPTGVGVPGPRLPDDVKEHLRTIAASKAGKAADLDGFMDLVDTAASQYPATRSLQEEASPATVRGELKAAHEASRRLIDCLNALGGTSRHLLYSQMSADERARFSEALMYVSGQLARARHRANELSRKGGAPLNYARIHLAALVAHAIDTRLGVKPTMTRGGLFEDVLVTVIEALETRKDPSVRDLMRAGLAAQVSERPDSGIEIDPRVG